MPQDRAAEQERWAEDVSSGQADTPREVRAQWADLRERLEQLPVGHPSSSYRDDGSRKPLSPDLSELELPLPDEPNSATGNETGEDAARIRPAGWWEWHGRKLSPEVSSFVDQTVAECRDAEGRDADGNYGDHGLTPAMRRIEAQLDHGQLVKGTEEFALKSPDRFKEKVAERIALQPDENVADIVSRIHDGIRYTFEYDEAYYTEGVYRTEAVVAEHGFDLITRKPSWDGLDYKGINSQWRDLYSGKLFEIQFHTHASWQAKQKTHDAYEKLSDPRTPSDEKKQLEEYQQRIAASVPIPPGALEIPYFRKEDG